MMIEERKKLKKEVSAAHLELLTAIHFVRRRKDSPCGLLECYAALICS
jgi:hypothetical protein